MSNQTRRREAALIGGEDRLGGCSVITHALLGRPGNNPYCHFRARALTKDSKRERLIPKQLAKGTPFDYGLFDSVTEPLDAPDRSPPVSFDKLVQLPVHWRTTMETAPECSPFRIFRFTPFYRAKVIRDLFQIVLIFGCFVASEETL